MCDSGKIDTVMGQTGADYETAKAALKTSDGDVDIAVRIICSYNLKDEAKATAGGSAGGQSSEESAKQAGQTGQAGQSKTGGQPPPAQDIFDAIKEIWNKGNASRLDIEKGGRTVLSISLTVGTIGLVLAPVAALIGIGAALITEYTIKITLDNGTVINVNEFAVTHKKATRSVDN